MHIENMCQSIETLASAVQGELSKGVEGACVEELAQATDMLSDLNEALYYATIVKEMKEAKKEEETLLKSGVNPDMTRFYNGRRYYYDPVIHDIPRYYDGARYYDGNRYYRSNMAYMTDGGTGAMGSTGGGMRGYNDNRFSNGRYAPDGNTMRGYNVNYPNMYDPANAFNQNKWRLDKGSYNPLESKYDKARRYYSESKTEHDKGTEEDNNAKLKFLGEFLDTASDDIVDIYNDASSSEQDMIMKKMSTLLSKMK